MHIPEPDAVLKEMKRITKNDEQDSIYTSLQSDGFGIELSEEEKAGKINWFMQLP